MFEKSNTTRKIHALISGRPMNFSFVDEAVSGSACPASKREILWLSRNGIRAILSLTVQPLKQEWLNGFAYRNVPIPDHSIPTVKQIRESVDFILKSGSKTLVHCAAGKGRTGVILASYMCVRYGLGPEQAIAQIRSKRLGSVERKQEVAVKAFYEETIKKHAY
jgi:atypical dual specificity phosphatase